MSGIQSKPKIKDFLKHSPDNNSIAIHDFSHKVNCGRRFKVKVIGIGETKKLTFRKLFHDVKKIAKKEKRIENLQSLHTFLNKLKVKEIEAENTFQMRAGKDYVYRIRSWFHRLFQKGNHSQNIDDLMNHIENRLHSLDFDNNVQKIKALNPSEQNEAFLKLAAKYNKSKNFKQSIKAIECVMNQKEKEAFLRPLIDQYLNSNELNLAYSYSLLLPNSAEKNLRVIFIANEFYKKFELEKALIVAKEIEDEVERELQFEKIGNAYLNLKDYVKALDVIVHMISQKKFPLFDVIIKENISANKIDQAIQVIHAIKLPDLEDQYLIENAENNLKIGQLNIVNAYRFILEIQNEDRRIKAVNQLEQILLNSHRLIPDADLDQLELLSQNSLSKISEPILEIAKRLNKVGQNRYEHQRELIEICKKCLKACLYDKAIEITHLVLDRWPDSLNKQKLLSQICLDLIDKENIEKAIEVAKLPSVLDQTKASICIAIHKKGNTDLVLKLAPKIYWNHYSLYGEIGVDLAKQGNIKAIEVADLAPHEDTKKICLASIENGHLDLAFKLLDLVYFDKIKILKEIINKAIDINSEIEIIFAAFSKLPEETKNELLKDLIQKNYIEKIIALTKFLDRDTEIYTISKLLLDNNFYLEAIEAIEAIKQTGFPGFYRHRIARDLMKVDKPKEASEVALSVTSEMKQKMSIKEIRKTEKIAKLGIKNEYTNGPNLIDSVLPKEILHVIFSHLDLRSLRTVSVVQKLWSQSVTNTIRLNEQAWIANFIEFLVNNLSENNERISKLSGLKTVNLNSQSLAVLKSDVYSIRENILNILKSLSENEIDTLSEIFQKSNVGINSFFDLAAKFNPSKDYYYRPSFFKFFKIAEPYRLTDLAKGKYKGKYRDYGLFRSIIELNRELCFDKALEVAHSMNDSAEKQEAYLDIALKLLDIDDIDGSIKVFNDRPNIDFQIDRISDILQRLVFSLSKKLLQHGRTNEAIKVAKYIYDKQFLEIINQKFEKRGIMADLGVPNVDEILRFLLIDGKF